MRLLKPNSVEWKSFFVLMPVIAIGVCFVLFGFSWYYKSTIWINGFLIIMLIGLFIWYLDVLSTRFIHSKFSEYKNTIRRIVVLVIKQIIIVSINVSLILIVTRLVIKGFTIHPGMFWVSFLICIGITLIAMMAWEGNYIFQQWKQSLNEKEKYIQLALQSEFEMLKSQVNPHFLFNCFNTLSSLITEDKQRAEEFLNELSKVYRYLLRNNENGMSTLNSEIQFIQSYFQLLKTRHGEAVQLEIEIDKRYDNYLLPSLSLQMLVENAVKHNSLSKDKPLTIEIFTMVGNKLAVNNNIHPRLQSAPSGKIGLSNIRAKYELLKQPGFTCMKNDNNFTVVLPLI